MLKGTWRIGGGFWTRVQVGCYVPSIAVNYCTVQQVEGTPCVTITWGMYGRVYTSISTHFRLYTRVLIQLWRWVGISIRIHFFNSNVPDRMWVEITCKRGLWPPHSCQVSGGGGGGLAGNPALVWPHPLTWGISPASQAAWWACHCVY